MSCHRKVAEGSSILHTHQPHLSTPPAAVLALWSLGLGLARSRALTAVSGWRATRLQRQEHTVRPPWRAWCDEAEATRGDQRPALAVAACCVPLLPWSWRTWPGTPWALALDATTLGPRSTVLALRVVSRGGAIPVAWTIRPATVPQTWRRE
jgi:hypothetical protein